MEIPGNFSVFYRKWEELRNKDKQNTFYYNQRNNIQKLNFNHTIYGTELIKKLNLSQSPSSLDFQLFSISSQHFLFTEFLFSLTKTISPSPSLILSKYSHHQNSHSSYLYSCLKSALLPIVNEFHFVEVRQKLSLPNKKLTIYDSGKMNKMMQLLREQKEKGYKVVIFTQMSKMLDIFEIALNLINFTYLRLDGQTKVR